MWAVTMTDGIISQGLVAVRNKGIVYTTRKALVYISYRIDRWFQEHSGYLLKVPLGTERTLKIYLALFKFRCRHNLFFGGERTFWVGRSFKDCVYKTTYVDPAEVDYEVKGGRVPYIQDGDWDLGKREFTLHETIQKIFVDKTPASETEQYKAMQEAIKNKDWHRSRDCRTQEDLDAYFRTFEDIYRDYSIGICRTQDEVTSAYPDRRPRLYSNEVLLSIDREGRYMLESGGTHRLSIAKLLGLKSIPAVIIRKHYQYVKTKEDLA
jgi:hypothetical protein